MKEEIIKYISSLFNSTGGNNILNSNDPSDLLFESARNSLLWAAIFIYLFFAITMFVISFLYNKNKHENETDYGFMSLAIFFVLQVALSYSILPNDNRNDNLLTVLSGLNNTCLLYSFRFFDIVKEKSWALFQPTKWIGVCIIVFIFSITCAIYGLDKPDMVISGGIFLLLGIILCLQFKDRGSIILGLIAFLVCFTILLSQLFRPEIISLGTFQAKACFNFISLISNSALGTIFLILAYTWIFVKKKQDEIDSLQKSSVWLQSQIKEKDAILETLKTIENGLSGATQKITELEKERIILEEKLKEVERNKLPRLTKTEIRFVKLIKDGKTNSEISNIMDIGVDTVNSHRKNISNKIGIEVKKLNEWVQKNDINHLNP